MTIDDTDGPAFIAERANRKPMRTKIEFTDQHLEFINWKTPGKHVTLGWYL